MRQKQKELWIKFTWCKETYNTPNGTFKESWRYINLEKPYRLFSWFYHNYEITEISNRHVYYHSHDHSRLIRTNQERKENIYAEPEQREVRDEYGKTFKIRHRVLPDRRDDQPVTWQVKSWKKLTRQKRQYRPK